MTAGTYFHDEWWDMMWKPDPERQKVLRQEAREVRDEIIWQEYQDGKTGRQTGEEMGLHESHVLKIVRKKRSEA